MLQFSKDKSKKQKTKTKKTHKKTKKKNNDNNKIGLWVSQKHGWLVG